MNTSGVDRVGQSDPISRIDRSADVHAASDPTVVRLSLRISCARPATLRGAGNTDSQLQWRASGGWVSRLEAQFAARIYRETIYRSLTLSIAASS